MRSGRTWSNATAKEPHESAPLMGEPSLPRLRRGVESSGVLATGEKGKRLAALRPPAVKVHLLFLETIQRNASVAT